MTLEEGISAYVQRKRSVGMSYAKGLRTYRAFLTTVGNLDIRQITVRHISEFLDRPQTSVAAFRRTHSLVRRFFEYWAAHCAIAPLPMPPNRPAQRSHFLPYIYRSEELREVLRLSLGVTTANDKIPGKTIRAALLTLYATGATVSEVLRLGREDIDLRNGVIRFAGSDFKASRCIPIGRDLVRVAQQHAAWQKRMGTQSEFMFPRIDGARITSRSLRAYFERLCRTAEIAGYRQSSHRPCLRDLRATFAVHRITSWIKKRADLNKLLPALAAYMGNAGLETTERYLQMAPERFQNALNKLSPQVTYTRWQDDPALLEFLTNL